MCRLVHCKTTPPQRSCWQHARQCSIAHAALAEVHEPAAGACLEVTLTNCLFGRPAAYPQAHAEKQAAVAGMQRLCTIAVAAAATMTLQAPAMLVEEATSAPSEFNILEAIHVG
jgi:hypothetical protein